MDKNRITQIWVRNMYQKFEAVCQDVDEFMNKDPVKYVENHFQTVGESVKKFYNGVMQDLILPPLIDNTNSVATNEEEGSLIPTEKCHKMSPTSEISESPVEESDTNLNFEHECDNDVTNNSYKNSESDDSVFEDANWGIEDIIDLDMEIEKKNEEKCENVFMETLVGDEFEFNSSGLSKMGSLGISCIENKEEKEKSYDSSSMSASSFDISSCESFTSFGHDTNNNDLTRFASSSSSSFALSNETTGEELDDSMVDFEDLDMETIDLTDKEEIGESCVIVEGEKVFYLPYGSQQSKSYKKFIRDAFMSRKKLTKEYEQLALWCAIDKEFSQKIDKNGTKSQVEDFHEPEWELL